MSEETPLEHLEEREEQHVPVLQQLSIAVGMLVLVFGTSYLDEVLAMFEEPEEQPAATATAAAEEEQTVTEKPEPEEEVYVDYFEDVGVTAKSAYVWDVQKQKALFNKNADERLPLASVMKLMTALVAYELLDDQETVNISVDAIRQDGESGFHDGELFSLENLSNLTLISSSNDGAHALAAAAGATLGQDGDNAETFVEAMNIRANQIGLTQTIFSNPTGLDETEFKGGGYGSARDMTFLMEYIITTYPELVEETTTELTTIRNNAGAGHTVENTNKVIDDIDGIIASKTGYTALAGGNLVVAFDAGLNRPIIVTVLGSTRNERFSDVLRLVDAARDHINQ